MTDLDLESSVPDWLIERPELYTVAKALGIDYSCSGKSLAAACRERGLDPIDVLQLFRNGSPEQR